MDHALAQEVLQCLHRAGFCALPSCTPSEFHTYLQTNTPVLLPGQGRAWPCAAAWRSAAGLAASLGQAPVPVEQGASSAYGAAPRTTQPLEDFLASGTGYLKDCRLALPAAAAAYALPRCLCDDALNPYLDERSGSGGAPGSAAFRFLYAGFPGTRTALHHDILASHSWSCSVQGTKLWLLASPSASALLYPAGRFQPLASDTLLPPGAWARLREALGAASAAAAPLPQRTLDALLASASSGTAPLCALLQAPGDMLFVPSGWHHEVINLGSVSGSSSSSSSAAEARYGTLTISVNHNWLSVCQGPALEHAWALLSEELAEVRARLQDCAGEADFAALCERVLRTDAGLGYVELGEMLCRKVGLLAQEVAAAAAPQAAAAPAGWEGGSSSAGAAVPPGKEEAGAQLGRALALAGLRKCARVLRCLAGDPPTAAAAAACARAAALAEACLLPVAA